MILRRKGSNFYRIILLVVLLSYVAGSPKRGGSRGGGSRSKSSWGGWGSKSSSKSSSSGKSKGIFGGIFGSKKNKNNPYKNGGYPKQNTGSSGFKSYNSGGKTVSNSNWPKNQIPAAGTFPKTNSWSNVGGFSNSKGMGTMGSYAGAGGLKSMMKSKGMYKTAVGLGTAYVGYKVAKGVGKTIGSAMWMGYPRIYGNQMYYYNMPGSYRYLGAASSECDVFYDILKQREVLRCDDWGNNRYNRYNNNGIGQIFSGIGIFILICCCCCCAGCGYILFENLMKIDILNTLNGSF